MTDLSIPSLQELAAQYLNIPQGSVGLTGADALALLERFAPSQEAWDAHELKQNAAALAEWERFDAAIEDIDRFDLKAALPGQRMLFKEWERKPQFPEYDDEYLWRERYHKWGWMAQVRDGQVPNMERMLVIARQLQHASRLREQAQAPAEE